MGKDGNLDKRSVVVQPADGPSYWQPVPANGYSHVKLSGADTGAANLASGFQHIAPGGHVRAHSHSDQFEILTCFQGRGRVVVDGESHTFVPGTTAFLGHNVRHEIINESDVDLVMQWLISPPGLDEFFAAIGRERQPGEPAPEPFARPDDVVQVESDMGFRDVGS